jgi:hypothetical protein
MSHAKLRSRAMNGYSSVYHKSDQVADPLTGVPDAKWVAFGRALVEAHAPEPGDRCACGRSLTACAIRRLARRFDIPVSPAVC